MIPTVILALLGAVVVILATRRPAWVLLGLGGAGLLGLWLTYGTVQPCHLLAYRIAEADQRAGKWAAVDAQGRPTAEAYFAVPLIRLWIGPRTEGECLRLMLTGEAPR